ncbi:MAG: barstar family protein [Lachnospiraceae bacterium]|nr:barstar family protein [Lachnospiraceae bacterium]
MVVVIDGRKMTDKATLHTYLKEQCKFPEYYGNNLDALYDVLTDREEPLEIQLEYAQELKELLCGYGEAFIETLEDAAASCPNISFIIK